MSPKMKTTSRRQWLYSRRTRFFEGDEDDARGDDRLDHRGRQADPAGRGHPEGDRVGEGEGRHLEEEGFPFPAHQEQAEDEEDVVEPEREDVEEAAFHSR